MIGDVVYCPQYLQLGETVGVDRIRLMVKMAQHQPKLVSTERSGDICIS
jgi:hypothetical protein